MGPYFYLRKLGKLTDHLNFDKLPVIHSFKSLISRLLFGIGDFLSKNRFTSGLLVKRGRKKQKG
jgi:hypothetical protein